MLEINCSIKSSVQQIYAAGTGQTMSGAYVIFGPALEGADSLHGKGGKCSAHAFGNVSNAQLSRLRGQPVCGKGLKTCVVLGPLLQVLRLHSGRAQLESEKD